jgi:hypothetical protein
LDILDEIPLATNEKVNEVQMLQKDGSFTACAFEKTEEGIIVKTPAYTLLPVVLLLDIEE